MDAETLNERALGRNFVSPHKTEMDLQALLPRKGYIPYSHP